MLPEHWRCAALDPPYAFGGPLGTGALRVAPEDFIVEEILGFAASGEGPHALLRVRKRGANTEWVARELARAAGCKPFEVGFAGLKDRNAVTEQHFTLPRGKRPAEDFASLAGEGYEVLSATAHQRKLPRGALEGNRFVIVVRDLVFPHSMTDAATDAAANPAALAQRMDDVCRRGVPNYFGPQRFGRDGGNLQAVLNVARSLAESDAPLRRRPGDDQGFMLSAARSVMFNAMVAARVEQGSWDQLLVGDVANLDGRGSVFPVDTVDAELQRRCAELDLHATAPLMGAGETMAGGTIAAQESEIAAQFPEALAVISAAEMKSERRAMRLRVRDLEHEYADGVLRLSFSLPAGSFATTVLREIIASTAILD